MSLRTLLIAGAATLASASAALAGNVAVIAQTGGFNSAYTQQLGKANTSVTLQSGIVNGAKTVQFGKYNDAGIGQTGLVNGAAVYQYGPRLP